VKFIVDQQVEDIELPENLKLNTFLKEFKVDLSVIHNDSTSVKFYGAYKDAPKRAVKLKRGHSKDHRPDLKQLIYNLSITEDGAMPIHFKCHDGNKTDDTLHIETWLTLRALIGRSDFLYVADSKLCTNENMKKIDQEAGRFITLVPKTRAETQEFEKECHDGQVRWTSLTRRKSTRKRGSYDVFQIAEGSYQLSEGYRLYWYRSSEKRKRDEESRKQRIHLALEKLAEIESKRRRGPKSEHALLKAAMKIVTHYRADEWINVDVKTKKVETYRKTSVGKPGPEATYRRHTKHEPYLVMKKNYEGITNSASVDGIFPLTTNTKLDAKEVLKYYKYQPYLEKRFSWIKSDYEIAPIFLKKVERIEAIMFACFVADLVAATVQRELRNAMKKHNIQELKTLPENRPSKTPTWEQLQRLFMNHSKYELKENSKLIKTFWDPLSPYQIQVLDLLKIPKSAYRA